jgi:phosphatidylserine/phosphatidylglycerophosphate/cardiolipin synthase-like enzyme
LLSEVTSYSAGTEQHLLLIQKALRNRIAEDRSVDPATVPQENIDKIFTLAHLEHQSGSEIYLHAKHMIVDDLWMVISSSNFSRRGMTYETEIGVYLRRRSGGWSTQVGEGSSHSFMGGTS